MVRAFIRLLIALVSDYRRDKDNKAIFYERYKPSVIEHNKTDAIGDYLEER